MKEEQKNNPLSLKKSEIMAIEGVHIKEQQLHEKFILPLKEEWNELVIEICERLGLPEGAIGTTHIIDVQSKAVIEIPQEQAKSLPELPTEVVPDVVSSENPS